MFTLTEFVAPRPQPWWPLLRQVGIDDVVAVLRGGEQEQRMFAALRGGYVEAAPDSEDVPWGLKALTQDVATFRAHGFRVAAIEDTAPLDAARLGLPGRDEQIDNVITQVRAMGELGIPVLGYNWMARSSWARTRIDAPTRGGALATAFRREDAERLGFLNASESATDGQLWDALRYFLEAVVPEAEQAGVRLALHPDDPPLPAVRGLPRIMSSVDAFSRLRQLKPSPANAITFCQGNFALMTDDVPAAIHELGADGGIAFVHFRDVRGTAEDFVETFHDDGQTDMAACMRAYRDVGFKGPLRPDHVPTMTGEPNDRPGYHVLGRLFAAGYIRGLEQALADQADIDATSFAEEPARRG